MFVETPGFMTVPEVLDQYQPYHVTGNEYVSLPMINARTGGVENLNLIHLERRSLLEFAGTEDSPLLEPFLWVEEDDGQSIANLEWETVNYWVPRLSTELGSFRLKVEIITPPHVKGVCMVFHLTNLGRQTKQAWVGLRGHWSMSRQVIFTGRPINTVNHCYFDSWTQSLILEMRPDTGLAALALGTDAEPDLLSYGVKKGGESDFYLAHSEINVGREAGEFQVSNSNGVIWYRLGRRVQAEPGEEINVAFYLGVNLEGDGAGTTLVDLRRSGWQALRKDTLDWLEDRCQKTGNPVVDRIVNRNLFFNYFYSQGRSLDTEELVLMTSRSPRYYVSAAFWPRDTFLWSFPAILMTDPPLAREILRVAFRRHLRNAALHAHYIDGVLLYPGFELDQLCAFGLALERYIRTTGDVKILDDKVIYQGLSELEGQLWTRKSPNAALFSTFLDPADDPVIYPYLTYNNALVSIFLAAVSGFREYYEEWERAAHSAEWSARVKQDIMKYCVVEGPEGPIFAWAVDLKGGYQVYDNPPGSLLLLGHYGFCDYDDPVFRNTVAWVHSTYNPFAVLDGNFTESSSAHAPFPWVLGACNSILAGRVKEGKEFLIRATMDNGLACETVDSLTGMVKTGAAFATCAGFLCYALAQAASMEREIYHGHS